MSISRKFMAMITAAGAATLMVACSDSGSSETVTVTETPAAEKVTETVTQGADTTVTETAGQQQQPQQQRPENIPSSISSWSTQAEMELEEERLTKEEVEQVVAAVAGGEGRAEWDREGYFELEHNGIDVDITESGEVLDVSR